MPGDAWTSFFIRCKASCHRLDVALGRVSVVGILSLLGVPRYVCSFPISPNPDDRDLGKRERKKKERERGLALADWQRAFPIDFLHMAKGRTIAKNK